MAADTNLLKKVVVITATDFNTLQTEGSVTVGGITYTYDPTSTLYVIKPTHTSDDLWAEIQKVKKLALAGL
jgi:hypothetical protein